MVGSAAHSQEIETSLKTMFDTVFVVPAADEIYETQKAGIPISHYAPQSVVGKAYERIARSIRFPVVDTPIANKS